MFFMKKTIKKVIKKPVKKVAKKTVIKSNPPSLKLRRTKEKLIGKVLHYFDKIGVAVFDLKFPLAVGDTIRIEGGENTDFKQTITSMQINHQKVQKAKKGQDVGVRVKEPVRDGYRVYICK